MTRSIAATLAAVLATAALAVPTVSVAREGNSSTSIGHGIKCRTVAVLQADGTVRYERVCTKGV